MFFYIHVNQKIEPFQKPPHNIWLGLFQEEWHTDSRDDTGDEVMWTQWGDSPGDISQVILRVFKTILYNHVHFIRLERDPRLCDGWWSQDVQRWCQWHRVSPVQEVVVLPSVLHLHLPHGHLLSPLRQGLRSSLLQKGEKYVFGFLLILWLFKSLVFNLVYIQTFVISN